MIYCFYDNRGRIFKFCLLVDLRIKIKGITDEVLKNTMNRLFFGIAAFGLLLTGCASSQNDNISRLSLIQKKR